MAGAWTTKSINFNGVSLNIRVWDESGIGSGPYSFGQVFADGSGGNTPAAFSPPGAQATNLSASIAPATDMRTLPMSQDTNTLLNGNTALTPVDAPITASASGATTLVALVAAKKIRVLSMFLSANGAVNAKFQSHTTTATATGLIYCAAAGDGLVLPFNPLGWFDTVAGEALDINLSGTVAVGGQLKYVAV